MLRTLAAMALLCLSCSVLTAQYLSPLFGVLASHSPLQRPELFQKLQDDLPDYLKDIEPGLRMPFLDEKFQEFESKLYNALNNIQVTNTNSTIVINVNGKELCTIPWKPTKMPEIVTSSIELPKIVINSEIRMILWRIINHIDNPIIKRYAYVFRDSTSDDLKILIQEYFFELFKDSEFQEIFLSPKNVKDYFDIFLKDFREKIIQAMHIAQSEFNEVVAQASDYFINGNIGLSLTSGEGAFAGGILVGIKGKCGGAAIFTNLLGSSSEKEKKLGISQLGGRGYLKSQKCEYNFFFSTYLGSNDSTKKDFCSWEGGLGGSFRCGEKLTVGFAGTVLGMQGENPAFNLGILLNGVSQYLPTFVVGAGYQTGTNNDHAYPIFQIIQPINAR